MYVLKSGMLRKERDDSIGTAVVDFSFYAICTDVSPSDRYYDAITRLWAKTTLKKYENIKDQK